MNVYESLLLDYAHLRDGDTQGGELCPVCRGGNTQERTLVVSVRHETLLWLCYRASCGFKGARNIGGRSNHLHTGTNPVSCRGAVGREILRHTGRLPQEIREDLRSRYGITEAHESLFAIGWDNTTNRLSIPVRNFRSEPLGVVLRSLNGAKPKTLTHTEKDSLSWFVNHTARGVIIVEDQFSAIRASDYLTSVALLGTHLNEQRVAEIKASGLSPVYLALDADAWQKAVGYAIKYRSQLKPQLIRLTKDIKDMNTDELSLLIKGLGE